MASIAEFNACSQCSLEIRCRLECSICSQAICYDCSGFKDKRSKFFEHGAQHGRGSGFTNVFPPTMSITLPLDHKCDCMRTPGCFTHCEACFKCAYVPIPLSALFHHAEGLSLCESYLLQSADYHSEELELCDS